MTNNKPAKKFKAGGIVATIWQNQQKINGNDVTVSSVKLEKRYKDKEGNWQSASSLAVNDIPKARLVLAEAYKYLTMKQEQDGGETA